MSLNQPSLVLFRVISLTKNRDQAFIPCLQAPVSQFWPQWQFEHEHIHVHTNKHRLAARCSDNLYQEKKHFSEKEQHIFLLTKHWLKKAWTSIYIIKRTLGLEV